MASKADEKYYICGQCGYIGKGEMKLPGSRFVEIMLWSILLIPGPFYSAWRHFSRYRVCPKCKNRDTLVLMDSLRGKALLEKGLALGQSMPKAPVAPSVRSKF